MAKRKKRKRTKRNKAEPGKRQTFKEGNARRNPKRTPKKSHPSKGNASRRNPKRTPKKSHPSKPIRKGIRRRAKRIRRIRPRHFTWLVHTSYGVGTKNAIEVDYIIKAPFKTTSGIKDSMERAFALLEYIHDEIPADARWSYDIPKYEAEDLDSARIAGYKMLRGAKVQIRSTTTPPRITRYYNESQITDAV